MFLVCKNKYMTPKYQDYLCGALMKDADFLIT